MFSKSILAAHGRECPYCGVVMLVKRPRPTKRPEFPTRDHVIPKSIMPGQPKIMVCTRCNNDKRADLLSQWLVRLRADNDPRAPRIQKFISKNAAQLGDFA